MADIKQIQFKRSTQAGKRPLPADIAEGELALNLADRMIFTKDSSGAVVDLGFAKGGTVTGNIIHTGDYVQNGAYQLNGNMSTIGTITAEVVNTRGAAGIGGNLTVGGNILSNRGVIESNGQTGTAHYYMYGSESGNLKERAVIFAGPQTDISGRADFRVQNGYGPSATSATFNFGGNGAFSAPASVNSPLGSFGTRVTSPQGYIDTVNHDSKGENLWSSEDMNNYSGTSDSSKYNRIWRGRVNSSNTTFHQLVDTRTGQEIAYYTGATGPTNKILSIAEDGLAAKTFMVGDATRRSGLGDNSIAIGAQTSGLKGLPDGSISILVNNNPAINVTPNYNALYKQTYLEHRVDNTVVLPSNNSSLLEINTSTDGNTVANGRTLIGFVSDSKYYHYFRGLGSTNIETAGGFNVNAPSVFTQRVIINSTLSSNNTLIQRAKLDTAYGIDWNTDITLTGNKNYLWRARSTPTSTIWHQVLENGVLYWRNGITDSIDIARLDNTGSFEVENNITAKGGYVNIRSDGNTHVWFRNNDGSERSVFWNETSSGSQRLRLGGTFTYSWTPEGRFVHSQAWSDRAMGMSWADGANIARDRAAYVHNLGSLQNNGSYFPSYSCYSTDGTRGYYQSFDFGVIQESATTAGWRLGIIRMVGDSGSTNQARWTYYMNGLLVCPGQVNASEFYLSSDARLKKNVVELERQSDKLHAVRIKQYDMIDGRRDGAIGVIAQELEEVYPNMVSINELHDNKDGDNYESTKSVNYREMSTVLWKIVQEKDIELQDVKARLARIEELLAK